MRSQLEMFFTGGEQDGGGVGGEEWRDGVLDVLMGGNGFLVLKRKGIEIGSGCGVRDRKGFVGGVFKEML
ncbi:hypothetical protein, partial [Neisseria sicca]|uniref:hypothetical protein n=1 Tax=Neisseria sicca TaxID=490 RepID=UPI001C996DCF